MTHEERHQGDPSASVLAALPDPVVVLDDHARLIWANQRAESRFGWSAADLRGRSVAHLAHPDDLETALASLGSVADKEVGSLVELRLSDAAGGYAWFEVRGSRWDAGPPGSVVLVLREMTDRRRWELARGDTALLGAILDAAPTMHLLLGREGNVRGCSRAVTRVLHRPLDVTVDRPFLDLIAPGDRLAVSAVMESADGTTGTRTLEVELRTADGSPVPVQLTFVDLCADRVVQGIVVAAVEIRALVEARAELEHRALHDDLTGLPNRRLLRRAIEEARDGSRDGGHTLLFCDLDGLKRINDRHGHRSGDMVLTQVAGRLAQVVRTEDLVARLGGDEFVMLLPTDDRSVVDALRRRIADALVAPVRLADGTEAQITLSVGEAPVRREATVDELLAVADAAMYEAKRGHGHRAGSGVEAG